MGKKFFKPNHQNQQRSNGQEDGHKVVEAIPEKAQDIVRTLSEPVVVEADDDFEIVVLEFVDGRKYRLQHPGVRQYLKWRDASLDLAKGRMDSTSVLENFFEHCCFPEGHSFKPSLDTIKPRHLQHWQEVATAFLQGSLGQK